MQSKRIGIFGVGHFGAAVAKGMVERGFVKSDNLFLVQRGESKATELSSRFRCPVVSSPDQLPVDLDLLVVSIRPQDFAELLPDRLEVRAEFVVSVMAGVKQAVVQERLKRPVVRAMPNIAAPLGAGVTVYRTDEMLARPARAELDRLLAHWGVGIPVEDENLLDSATAISGSGPGILFWFFAQCLSAAESLGFSRESAELLVRYTARGALAHWESSAESLERLVEKVASKGGTTEAALKRLEADKSAESLKNAFLDAAKRCRALNP